MARAFLLLAFTAFLGGCSLIFLAKDCAESPGVAVTELFAAFSRGGGSSENLEGPPTDLLELFDFQAVIRVTPDPKGVMSALGKGNLRKGWEEVIFLKSGLVLFHNSSGLEFLEYRMAVERLDQLLSAGLLERRYALTLRRTDILLDVDRSAEARKFYRRDFLLVVSSGGNCVLGLTPLEEWQEASKPN